MNNLINTYLKQSFDSNKLKLIPTVIITEKIEQTDLNNEPNIAMITQTKHQEVII